MNRHLKIQIGISLIFFLIAALAGLVLRMAHIGIYLHDYKNLLHTHSHIALLGWLYNACFITIHFKLFPNTSRWMNRLFYITQITFLGMLFSFPFEGYGLFSITFSTLYLFCTYFLVYRIFREKFFNDATRRFLRWGGIYLILSSIGPFALGVVMAKDLQDTFWYPLAIYFFLHFLYNGFFVFVVFAWMVNKAKSDINTRRIFNLMNWSLIPSFALSVLWLEPHWVIYLISLMAASVQFIAFIMLLRETGSLLTKINKRYGFVLLFSMVAYCAKMIFQLIGSIGPVQEFVNSTIPFSVIGFIHLVMLGFFSLFFIWIIIKDSEELTILKLGIWLFTAGVIVSEILLFTQSLLVYFWHKSILNYSDLIFWVSTLMPLGIISILVSFSKRTSRK